jgi:hypothetical protein
MNSILRFETLLPVGLLVVQTFVLLFICIFVLRKLKILKTPYAGLEYSQLILASAFLFGVFFISTAGTGALFQVFKIFQNAGSKLFSNTVSKFGQFFLVILFFEFLFGLVSFFIIKLLFGFKNSLREIEEGNIPSAVLMAVITVSVAVVFQFSTKQIIDFIVPVYINFR